MTANERNYGTYLHGKNYRNKLGSEIKAKKLKIATQTQKEELQKALFQEWYQSERTTDQFQESKQAILKGRKYEKEHGNIDWNDSFVSSAKSERDSQMNKANHWNINAYLKSMEKSYQHNYSSEELKLIIHYIIRKTEEELCDLRKNLDLFRNYESRNQYLNIARNPDEAERMLQDLTPEIKAMVTSIAYFFSNTLHNRFGDQISCPEEELKKIYSEYEKKVIDFIAMIGDIDLFEEFTKHISRFHGLDFECLENIKTIALLQGNIEKAYIVAGGGVEQTISRLAQHADFSLRHKIQDLTRGSYSRDKSLTSDELIVLANNKKRAEEKDDLMSKIYHCVAELSRLTSDPQYNDKDYYVRENSRDYGSKGRPLLQKPIGEIRKILIDFELSLHQIKQLQTNQKNQKLAEIIQVLQQRKPKKRSKKNSN